MYQTEIAEIDGSPMDILLFRPEGDGPFPGLVVAQHIPIAHEGLQKDPFTIDIGERLAKAGYGVAIPFIFHWWPPEEDRLVKRDEFRDDNLLKDLDAAYATLSAMDGVDQERIGIMGHCWGGRVSWLGAARNPGYKAAAIMYGGRVKVGMGDGAPTAISLAGNIKCPVLGIFGNDDKNPTPEDVDDYEAALKDAGIDYTFHRYAGAGHGFQDFCDEDRYSKEASDDAWTKQLAFFETHLK
jgi:carboxymethylenebutenolidase